MLTRWLPLLLLLAGGAPGELPRLYVPFDGGSDAVVAAGDARELAATRPEFAPGIRGQAVMLCSDVRFATAGTFPTAAGTFACWVRPEWPGSAAGPHYVFSLYGEAGSLQGYQANRWSITAGGGRLTYTLFSAEGKGFGNSAPIAGWKAGEWHHVAATWRGVGSGRADAELHLFLDGAEAGPAVTGAAIPIGRVGATMEIGRDSDASPDYADAAVDEVYLYDRALTPTEIARAVREARLDGPRTAASVPAARVAPGWGDIERPYRVQITLPAEKQARDRVFAALPLDLSADLSRLGIHATLDPASFRLIRTPAPGAAADSPIPPYSHTPTLPTQLRDNRLEWADGPVPAGEARAYTLYFRAAPYDFSVPLLAYGPETGKPSAAAVPIPDYATETYGDAWDFDEGDLEAIDQWGNRPEYIRGRSVDGGVLKLDVSDDPFFVWGDMWGQVQRSQRPVRIDLARYPVLEMRVRQSVDQATWQLFGRPEGSDNLLRYEFPVSGSGWQTLRIDLRRQARWGGTITAFRIDPTDKIAAHVEIDWVRLTPLTEATRGAVELLGTPSGTAARVAVTLEAPQPLAGAEQTVTVTVLDAAGRRVAEQPVRLALAAGSGGSLDADPASPSLAAAPGARRALTGPDGTARFRYRASPRATAGADRLDAVADFTPAGPAEVAVTPRAGAAHHYAVEPLQPLILRPGDPAPRLTARLVDEHGNPLPVAGRKLRWSAAGASLEQPGAATAPDGSATAVLRTDPAQRWVTKVTVSDDAGLSGESAPICALPAGPRPDPVRIEANGSFGAGGKPWLPLGGFYANWVGTQTPDGEWKRLVSFTDATDEEIVAWLRFLKASGVTAQRFMLRTHRRDGMEPMDIGGRVNPGLFASFLHYLDLARPFGIRFLLVIHEDYTKPLYYNAGALERWALPWYAGENLDALPPFQRRFIRDRDLIDVIDRKYSDPDVRACQDQYAREIIGLVKENPLVFGYELENEMVNCPADWANHAMEVIRQVDPTTPVCVSHGGGGLHTADPAWWKAKTTIDFYTYHLYPMGSTTPEVDYGTAVDILTRYGRIGKPAMFGESAGDEFNRHPDRDTRRWTMRDIIWFSLTNGNPGCFFWNARGSEVAEFRLAQLIAGRIDWGAFRRKKPAVAVAVPHPLDDDKWFRTPEGTAARAAMARYSRHYLDEGVDFDFALEPAGTPLVARLEPFAPPEPLARDFSISPGCQLASATRADGGEALVYVRSFAGVMPWELDGRTMYLRKRAPVPVRVTVGLPGRFRVDAWDLDTGAHTQRVVASGESIDLGTTDHDFALHVRRGEAISQ